MKRILKVFMGCLMVVLIVLATTTSISAKNNEGSGKCGDNLTWKVDNSGLLTISGQGAMYDNSYEWRNKGYDVYRLVVEEGVTHIGDSAFSIGGLKSVTLPSTLESIGKNAFSWTAFTTIELPDGLKTIGASAFRSSGLTEIEVPQSVEYIGDRAFMECFSLKKVSLPDGLTSIPDFCFSGCMDLETVNIPSKATLIGSEAFRVCTNLKSVDFPEGLETIEYFAFSSSGLEELQLPSSLKNLGRCAFEGTKIKSVVIPETLTNIESGVFGYTPLTNVILPETMKYLPSSIFTASGLTRLYIPSGVETIGTVAFRWSDLTTIYIPLTVTRFELGAFYFTRLTDVFYEGSKEDWEKIGIDDMNFDLKNATIHYNSVGGLLDPKNAKTINFHVGMADGDKQNMELTIPWDEELFAMDSTAFHNEMAIPCLALSGSVEWDIPNTYNMLGEFGFDKEQLFAGYFNTDFNYLQPAAVFGYKQIELEGEKKNLFVVIVRGTSNGSDVLTDLSGAIGGFGVASNNMKSRFIEYVQEKLGYSYEEAVARSDENVLLVTGHSLGGAIANHLSVDLMGFAPKEKSFVYTFAAPQSFLFADIGNYNKMTNVFNVVNLVDKVPYLPPLGYYRIGNDRCFSSTWGRVQEYFKRLTQGKSYQEAYGSDWGWFLAPHAIETYMAYLMMLDNGTILNQHPPVKVVGIHCPVDVEIYDDQGVLVGRIKDNQIDGSIVTDVALYVDGDEKYVVLFEDKEYSFVMTGTDDGVMTYEINMVDFEKKQVTEVETFNNVALKQGKTMVSEIAPSSNEKPKLIAVNENKEPIAEITTTGKEISLIEEIESSEATEGATEIVEESSQSISETNRTNDGEIQETKSGDDGNAEKSSWMRSLKENLIQMGILILVVFGGVVVLIIIITLVIKRKGKK